MWVGNGCNSKSTAMDLLYSAFGNYCSFLPFSEVTRKKSHSIDLSPVLADKRGKKLLILQEPEVGDKINCGILKELIGNDKIMARELRRKPYSFTPQFSLLMVCSKLPDFPSDDYGIWRRLKVTPWNSRFIENPVESNEFKKLESFNIKHLKQPFMWLLINKYFPMLRLAADI